MNRLFHQLTRRDVAIIVVAVIGVAVYALVTHLIAGNAGFPLDDAWIHQTYGRNLAYTGQWEYVPGVRSAGSTSPLYTVLLAIGYALHTPFFLWTYGLGAVALALNGIVGARLADRLFPQSRYAGIWTGLALVTAWHLLWAAGSGMETMLFGALSVLLILLAWKFSQRSTITAPKLRSSFVNGITFGLIGALLIATRPEGIVLVGLLVFTVVISQPFNTFLRVWLLGALVGGVVGIGPYALLNLMLNGTLLPTTFSAKQAENAPLLAQPFLTNLWAMLQPLTAGGQVVLVPGMLWTVWRLIRKHTMRGALFYLVLLAWPLVLILLYVLR